MTVDEGCNFFDAIPMIKNKLKTLQSVGLGYIKIGQQATTLSGGEAQRIKLSKELSKRSTGKTLYILDEPTTGLHVHDIKKLLEVLQILVTQGNTVIVIEHNLDVIKTADWIIDLGPEGGDGGGEGGGGEGGGGDGGGVIGALQSTIGGHMASFWPARPSAKPTNPHARPTDAVRACRRDGKTSSTRCQPRPSTRSTYTLRSLSVGESGSRMSIMANNSCVKREIAENTGYTQRGNTTIPGSGPPDRRFRRD